MHPRKPVQILPRAPDEVSARPGGRQHTPACYRAPASRPPGGDGSHNRNARNSAGGGIPHAVIRRPPSELQPAHAPRRAPCPAPASPGGPDGAQLPAPARGGADTGALCSPDSLRNLQHARGRMARRQREAARLQPPLPHRAPVGQAPPDQREQAAPPPDRPAHLLAGLEGALTEGFAVSDQHAAWEDTTALHLAATRPGQDDLLDMLDEGDLGPAQRSPQRTGAVLAVRELLQGHPAYFSLPEATLAARQASAKVVEDAIRRIRESVEHPEQLAEQDSATFAAAQRAKLRPKSEFRAHGLRAGADALRQLPGLCGVPQRRPNRLAATAMEGGHRLTFTPPRAPSQQLHPKYGKNLARVKALLQGATGLGATEVEARYLSRAEPAMVQFANHASARRNLSFVRAEVQKMLDYGAVKHWPLGELGQPPQCTLPLGEPSAAAPPPLPLRG